MSDSKRPRIHFLRTTLVGGILFLVPISLLIVVLAKPLAMAKKVVAPLAEHMPFDSLVGLETPAVLAILLMLFCCFVAGLVARTSLARNGIRKIESSILSKVPGYEFIKGATEGLLGTESKVTFPVVVLNTDEIRQIALLIETGDDGLVTIFIPEAPSPRAGGVFFVPAESITPLDVPFMSAMMCIKHFGKGSTKLRGALPLPEGS